MPHEPDGPHENLREKSVFLVEDEASISMIIEDGLIEAGCHVIGPANTLDAAIELASAAMIDIALIDVHLRHLEAYPVVDVLAARAIPFILMTGYGRSDIKGIYRDRPVLLKPFVVRDALAMLSDICGSRGMRRDGRSSVGMGKDFRGAKR